MKCEVEIHRYNCILQEDRVYTFLDISRHCICGGKLARQLLLLGFEKRWEMINEVWIEMLAYAATHCPWKEHTHQLRRGGELLPSHATSWFERTVRI
jgi:hypothetical protein